MKDKKAKPEPLWIDISHIDMPRLQWIWWVMEGTLDAPGGGSRSFNSLHAMQENVRERGYTPPNATQVNEAVLQARVDGKDEATLTVSPK
jgi:hypothetical protein